MAIDIGQIKLNTPVSPPSKPVVERPEVVKVATERTLLEEERIYRRGGVTVRDLISPAAFEVPPKFLLLSGLSVRTIFIVAYPRHIGLGWSSPIINLNKNRTNVQS